MVDDWLLEHLAKVSALSCVLIVLYFLVYSIWRITRMPNYPWNWNDWQWPLGGGRNAVEIYRKPTQMPFTIVLDDDSKDSSGRCTFTIQYLKNRPPPNISVLWGPSAPYLMSLVNSSWSNLRDELMIPELEAGQWSSQINSDATADEIASLKYFIQQRCQYEGESQDVINENGLSEVSHSTAKLALAPPLEFDWNLLKNQFRYPVAIFITDSEGSEDDEFSIRGVVLIVHLKTLEFPKPSTVLAQYIKMNSGQSHMLQPLYVIDDHRLDEDDEQTTSGAHFR